MERLNVIGIEASISSTGYMLAEVYVAGGGHENIAQVPIRDTGRTIAVGHAYTRDSEVHPGQTETAWKFHALPNQGLALLESFSSANIVGNRNVAQALEKARVMATTHQPAAPITQISSYAIGRSRTAA